MEQNTVLGKISRDLFQIVERGWKFKGLKSGNTGFGGGILPDDGSTEHWVNIQLLTLKVQ